MGEIIKTMKRHSFWLLVLAVLAASLVAWLERPTPQTVSGSAVEVRWASANVKEAIAQTPPQLPDPPVVPTSNTPQSPTPQPDAPPSEAPAEFELEQVSPLETVDTAGLALAEGSYARPGQFQIGTLEGFSLTDRAGIPLFESSDRTLAYTVVSKLRANSRPLAPDELVQVAIETLDRGEGFQLGNVASTAPGEVQMNWTAAIDGKPLTGRTLARQVDRQVLVLLVSAVEESADKVDGAIAVLSDTLQTAPDPETQEM
ncbi:hypothetical protein AY599_23135 [Leptolyngbya valderiana BDU 20041]|nr:hypothetical protein AY599_23135 [Leptolyngbya valderiana BDU 20041]